VALQGYIFSYRICPKSAAVQPAGRAVDWQPAYGALEQAGRLNVLYFIGKPSAIDNI
jgi:hypothetical protein